MAEGIACVQGCSLVAVRPEDELDLPSLVLQSGEAATLLLNLAREIRACVLFNSQRLQALEQTFFLNKNLQSTLAIKSLPAWARSLPPEVTSVATPLEDIIKIGNYPALIFYFSANVFFSVISFADYCSCLTSVLIVFL